MSKNLKILLLSRVFSEFSGAMYPVVLPLFILKLSGSLAISGLFFTIVMLPQLLLMPVVGVWIEKKSKKSITNISLVVLCLLAGTEALLLQIGYLSLTFLGFISAAMSLLFAVIDLSTKILFSEIVPEKELEKYNGLKSVWDNIAAFGAPMISTLIYGFLGFKMVAAIVAIGYLIASIVLSKMTTLPQNISQDKLVDNPENSFRSNLVEGLRFVKEHKGVRNFYLLASALNFFVANQEEVINPGILIQKYHISEKTFGFVPVCFTLGVVMAGLLLAKKSEGSSRQFLKNLFIANSTVMMLMGALSIIFSGRNQTIFLAFFLILELVIGFITILINVPMTSYFQSAVPIGYQGRVFSLLSFISSFSIPLGVSYSGFLAAKIGADWTYLINNLCVIVIVIAVLGIKNKDVND
ncbi:MAG: MFS transporter [Streptococcaceae bacterium]|jgi:hypothetical protein|nr:MFS transporter [Streptococcaceae bacterium]